MNEPRRTCVGCRRIRPKSEMVRVVRTPEGRIRIDPTGAAPGRGAYVCDEECARAGRGRFGRALRAPAIDVASLAERVAEVRGTGGKRG